MILRATAINPTKPINAFSNVIAKAITIIKLPKTDAAFKNIIALTPTNKLRI